VRRQQEAAEGCRRCWPAPSCCRRELLQRWQQQTGSSASAGAAPPALEFRSARAKRGATADPRLRQASRWRERQAGPASGLSSGGWSNSKPAPSPQRAQPNGLRPVLERERIRLLARRARRRRLLGRSAPGGRTHVRLRRAAPDCGASAPIEKEASVGREAGPVGIPRRRRCRSRCPPAIARSGPEKSDAPSATPLMCAACGVHESGGRRGGKRLRECTGAPVLVIHGIGTGPASSGGCANGGGTPGPGSEAGQADAERGD